MTREISKKWLVLPLLLLVAVNYMQHCVNGEPQVPCVFIFGDSLSDNGNNNNLLTSAKSNYKPYGIDFPDGATGRFTNGRTAIDITTQLLGFENFIPPFANTNGSDILKGVNYASGSAGIRVESGSKLGAHISLKHQLINHKLVVSKIANQLGGQDEAVQHLNKCLYYVNIGSNDFINNYFLPQLYPTKCRYSPEQYAQVLVKALAHQLKALHGAGARKHVLAGIGLIGCTPRAISNQPINESGCVDEQNVVAFIFNDKLKSLVDQFNTKFSDDSKYIFINTTAGTLDPSLGFKVLNASCCTPREDGQCAPDETPCHNRNEYVFWDQFHPTEAVNLITAITSYNGSIPAFTYPMDIKHLVQS